MEVMTKGETLFAIQDIRFVNPFKLKNTTILIESTFHQPGIASRTF